MCTEGEPPARDRRLASARTLLRQSTGPDGLSEAWRERARDVVEGLLELLRVDGDDVEVHYRLGWSLLLRNLVETPDDGQLETMADSFAVCLLAGVDDLPPRLLSGIASAAEGRAVALLRRTLADADPELLDTAVVQCRRVLGATPADHPGRPQRLANLGVALHTRFDRQRVRADLDEALALHRAAIEATPAEDPELTGRLNGLAGVLRARHELTGDLADLDAAVDAMRRAADASAADPARHAMCLSNLGLALRNRFRRSADPADLDAALDAARQAWERTGSDEPHRGVRLNNLGAALMLRCRQERGEAELLEIATGLRSAAAAVPWGHPWFSAAAAAVPQGPAGSPSPAATLELFALCFLSGLDELPPEVASGVVILATNYVSGLTARLYGSYDPAAHEAVVALWRRIVDLAPAGDPHRHVPLANLSFVMLLRHQRTGAVADLGAALDAARRSVREAPAGHPDQGRGLGNLAAALLERFRRENEEEDMDLAVDLTREALAHFPEGHGNRGRCLSDLGGALALRFHQRGDRADLDDAVAALREATRAEAADPLGPGMALANLGEVLERRYAVAGDTADLDEAVTVLRAALAATPEGHAAHVGCLASLGAVLQTRFARLGDGPDLDEAIGVLREAVAVGPPGSPVRNRSLHNLASALYVRLESRGEGDPDEIVSLTREALAHAPVDSAEHVTLLTLLTNALRSRFELVGDPADLAEAAERGSTVTRAASGAAHHDMAARLSAGAGTLLVQQLHTFSATDLDEAITALRTTLGTLAPGHAERLAALHNLALALMARCARTLSAVDLDAAIGAQRAALDEAGPAHSHRPALLNGLGAMLQARSTQTGVSADLSEAITTFGAAVEAAPPRHPMLHLMVANLGNSLLLKAEATGEAADLDAAVTAARLAVDAAPSRGTRRFWNVSVLGRALLHRHRRGGRASDLDEAVSVLRAAHRDTGDAHAVRQIVLLALAEALHLRSLRSGSTVDFEDAVRLYEEGAALTTASAMARVLAAVEGGKLVAESDPARAADLYETAVLQLPYVAPRQLHRREQQYMLGRFENLAADAAARALDDTGRPAGERALRALRLLETGRGVMLSQALDTFGDLSRLRRRAPELAARYETLRDLLDLPEGRTDALTGLTTDVGPDGVPVTGDRHRLVADLADVLAEVRRLDGFAGFGLPPSTEELLMEAREGAIVVLNVAALRSDALVLTGAGVTAVPLPLLTPEAAARAADAFRVATHDATQAPDEHERRVAQRQLSGILGQLWEAVAEPVLTALGHDGAGGDGAPPRLWWVPCGPLSSLPIHAAGRHDVPGAAVLDRVVSSYTPTVRALHHARRPLPEDGVTGRALVVAMPTTPGHAPLDWALDEVDVLQEHFPDRVVLGGADGPATSGAVLERLPGCSIAHFACHGAADAADPSHSLLFLQDHGQAPFTVARLATVRLDHARLAYLSACRTAVSHAGHLLDEAIHMTTAFQMSGFRQVIGTLWPVVDDTAVDVAEAFYTCLAPEGATGVLDPDRSAYALHAAVLALRRRLPATPSLWASHIHAGA
ncbi:CHAT domain-containing protein [Streptomyces sp. DSM 3412]|uniref:CHAT domain-containing protein n=1 Tax=Streptomyces gottesmaniae TaxID=3075518 RepID=A0ABU2ZAY0_9ACTN|nr:CHAT domain-containing protein [Streptomyces sp. DSM 3412]MDT0573757.1 CHAT domain-containing protein [Streptomyces sp. DSM 3412]